MGILDFTVFQDGMVLVTNFTQVRIHPPIGQKYLFGRVFTCEVELFFEPFYRKTVPLFVINPRNGWNFKKGTLIPFLK